MTRPARAVGVALALMVLGGCGADPEQDAVHAALSETLTALQKADWERLWELSAPAAREEVLAVHRELHAGLARVDDVYPEEAREAARDALGARLVSDIAPDADDLGPRLVSRLFDPSAIRLDEDARAGLLSTNATIDGARAVIHTAAGEAFTFERGPEGWRARLVMDILESTRRVTELRENARAVIAAADENVAAWRKSRDPRTPQGAYNLAVAAIEQSPPDLKAIWALIDDEARTQVKTALDVARQLQRAIQKRTQRKQRDAAYDKAGITTHVKTDSDEALFMTWAATDKFTPPLAPSGLPVRVDGDVAGGRVTVVTEAEGRVEVVRDDSGYWHIAGYAPVLRDALAKAPEQGLEALTAEKESKGRKKRR